MTMPPRLERVIAEIMPKCINFGCDNEGTIANQIGEDEWEPQQCEYCYRERFPLRDIALAAWNAALEAVREGTVKIPAASLPDTYSESEDIISRTAVTDHINSLGV